MQSASTRIRPWQADDFARLAALSSRLSARTLHLRFLSGVPRLPDGYLRAVESRRHSTWESVAAFDGDTMIGWAELGWTPGDPTRADVGVCVIDAEQGHGVGTQLLNALVECAGRLGLEQVHVDMAYENVAARRAWRAVTGSSASTVRLAAPLVA